MNLVPNLIFALVYNMYLLKEIQGNSVKQCSKSEEKSRLNARRSIVSFKKINAGEKLTESNIICKRPGTGICATKYFEVIGKTINMDINEDTIITSSMFNF